AADVGVSASALSQGLAELERRIGVELFERAGRRRLVRDAARPVVDHAHQVLALTGDLVAWRDRLRDGVTGAVRLGMIDVAAVVHFPDVLRGFRAVHPEVDVSLVVAPSRTLVDAVRTGDLDLVVCVEPPGHVDDLHLASLLSEPLAVFAPPGELPSRPAADWGPWVLFPSGSHTRGQVEAALTAAGATIDVAAESHQPDVIREMVRLGLGWTVLPRSQVDTTPGTAGDGLVAGPELLRRRLVLARRRGAIHDPVVELLARRLRAQPGDDA
ncbi:MAG: LysR family transcriptional regulator, partial [Actinomycetota bacterium]